VNPITWLSNRTIFHVIKEGCKSYKDQPIKGLFTLIIIESSQFGHKRFLSETKTLILKRWNICYKCKITLEYWLTILWEDVDAKKGNKISQNHKAKTMFSGRTWWTWRTNEKHSTQTRQYGFWIRPDMIKIKT